MSAPAPAPTLESVAVTTVFIGSSIPMHDQTWDLAETIGKGLDEFRAYVARVRDDDQAQSAVIELLDALKAGVS